MSIGKQTKSVVLILAFLVRPDLAFGMNVCDGLEGLSRAECLLQDGRSVLEEVGGTLTIFQVISQSLYPGVNDDRSKLIEAKEIFTASLGTFGQEQRALNGLTETVSWLVKGQTLLGNDHLVNALRMRFPPGNGNPPPIEDEVDLLMESTAEFEVACEELQTLLDVPAAFANSENNPLFPFNNYFDMARAISRGVRAGREEGDRLFTLGVNDSIYREQAQQTLRNTVQKGYLGSAMLAAAQSTSAFQTTGGDRIATQISIAKGTFDRIADGVNPLGFHGDYVPYLPYFDANPDRSLGSIANLLTGDGMCNGGASFWDCQARNTARTVDQNQTQLQSALADIRVRVIGQLFELSGVNPQTFFCGGGVCDLKNEQKILAFLDLAASGSGLLGQELAAAEEARAAFDAAYFQLQNVPLRIQVEQDRVGQVAMAVLEDVGTFQALAIAEGYANAFSYSFTAGFPPSASVSFSPGSIISGFINAQRTYLQAMQQVQIDGINSAATIKNMLIDQAEQAVAMRQLEARIKQAALRTEHLTDTIRSTIDEWAQSLAEAASGYWTDPGYRLEMEDAVERAHISLRNAQEWSFLAAKAIGYDWAEEFPGDAILNHPYGDFLGPEDVFGAPNADRVADFLQALSLYATWNFSQHGPTADVNSQSVSLREDILGYSDFDADCQCFPPGLRTTNVRLFKDFIRDHWSSDGVIQFEFAISIADNKLFPIVAGPNTNIWNVKINGIAADLSGQGLVVGPANFPEFSITVGGISTVRHYSANWRPGDPSNDLLVEFDLEAMNQDGSLRTANIQPSVGGFPPQPDYNMQLARLSPAATRWQIFIDTTQGDNVALDFQNLEDIQLLIRYDWGQPDPYTP